MYLIQFQVKNSIPKKILWCLRESWILIRIGFSCNLQNEMLLWYCVRIWGSTYSWRVEIFVYKRIYVCLVTFGLTNPLLICMKIASFLSVIFATMAVFVETATSLWFLLVKYNIRCPRSLLPHFGIFVHIDIQTTQQPVSLLAPHTRQGIRMVHLYCRSCHHSIKIQLNPTQHMQHMPTSYHSWSLWRSCPITYLSWWYLLTSIFCSQASMHDNMISVCDTITLQLYDICVTRCFIDHELFWLHNDQTVVLIGVWVHNYGGISFDHCFGRNGEDHPFGCPTVVTSCGDVTLLQWASKRKRIHQ